MLRGFLRLAAIRPPWFACAQPGTGICTGPDRRNRCACQAGKEIIRVGSGAKGHHEDLEGTKETSDAQLV